MNEELKKVGVLVRQWDSRNMTEITLEEYEAAEKQAGGGSAFAETRAVLNNGKVAGTEMSVHQYLRYRNS